MCFGVFGMFFGFVGGRCSRQGSGFDAPYCYSCLMLRSVSGDLQNMGAVLVYLGEAAIG